MEDRETAGPGLAPAGHGGNLGAASQRFPKAPKPWLDLSTGISPYAYPFTPLVADVFTRLPEPAAQQALEAVAAKAYGAVRGAEVVAAPGTQALLQWLPYLWPARRVGVLGFTYGEHALCWSTAGAQVIKADDLDALAGMDVAVVVNPNNPDGRIVPAQDLRQLGLRLAAHGGLLIVDEAFADFCGPEASLVPAMPEAGVIILRSFGKTYGLAGLRLGFAIAPEKMAARLRAALGPWAVSSLAIAIGQQALADAGWLMVTRKKLAADVAALDQLLAEAGFSVAGGTLLFRLARHEQAQGLFNRLGEAGILVRRFDTHPSWLRFGIPGTDADRLRLRGVVV
ncbi:MAG TPA: threonine-phosphate decarboxylase CobD [Beijerinckia sp.]|nr:threonine-phosphate decarboxylase CobD [Beijerinckia sp.]